MRTNPLKRIRSAFTLIELLIVISLLVLLAAMAIPAFNFITGSRSIEGAKNIANAMLGRTRLAAVSTGTYVGLFFYFDPATQRTTAVTVSYSTATSLAGDGMPNYKSYQGTGSYLGPDPAPPTTPRDRSDAPDEALYVTEDHTPAGIYNAEGGRPVVKHYVRRSPIPYGRTLLSAFAPPATNLPANSMAYAPTETRPANVEGWLELFDGNIELASVPTAAAPTLPEYSDVQVLPPGVGVQVIVDTDGVAGGERYLRSGMILFDPQGRVVIKPMALSGAKELGRLMEMQTNDNIPLTARWKSGLGVAFYDQQSFLSKAYTEGDSKFNIASLNAAANGIETGTGSEEEWLDQESDAIIVNRTTGTLLVTQ